MRRRIVPGFPELTVFLTTASASDAARRRRRRRTLAAFISGLCLFIGAVSAGVSVDAFARGGQSGNYITLLFPSPPPPPDEEGVVILPHRAAGHSAVRRAVCVKLCDGAFFPMSPGGGGDDAAACASQCPDAPTSVYYQASGSDRIEDAISATGAPYSALPVALRYRGVSDNTCSCHRHYSSASASLLTDPTLHKGDAVVTESGVLVFQGAQGVAHAKRDFAALASARIPAAQRTELLALDRVNRLAPTGAPKSWYAAKDAPVEPPPLLLAAQSAKDEIRFVQIVRGGAN